MRTILAREGRVRGRGFWTGHLSMAFSVVLQVLDDRQQVRVRELVLARRRIDELLQGKSPSFHRPDA